MDRYAEGRWGWPFVIIPFLPPTSNHIYVTDWRRKKRFLSKEADAFKKRAISHVQQEKLPAINELSEIVRTDDAAVFEVEYVFYFEDSAILNKTFGRGKKFDAETRYKKMDVENRVKLVADAFSSAIGIDDSQFFRGGHDKCAAKVVGGVPQIQVFFKQTDPRRFGL